MVTAAEHTYCFVLDECFSPPMTRQASQRGLFADKSISLRLTSVPWAPPLINVLLVLVDVIKRWPINAISVKFYSQVSE